MPHTFRDADGRDWTIRVDASTLRSVRDRCEIDLQSVYKDGEIRAAIADPMKLAEILYALCFEQVKQVGLTVEQFERGLDGNALDAAYRSFKEAMLEFYPSNIRQLYQRLLDAEQEAERQATERISKALDDGLAVKLVAREMSTLEKALDGLRHPSETNQAP